MAREKLAMTRWGEDLAEVEAFLNAEGARQTGPRKPHHLPDDWYETTAAVYCVTLCARHHGQPFLAAELAGPVVTALRHYRDRGACKIYAYCLMTDHLHTVLRLL